MSSVPGDRRQPDGAAGGARPHTDHRAGPGDALFAFLSTLVAEGAKDQGLVEALAGSGVDFTQIAEGAEQRFMDALGGLLIRAQRAGTVRSDIDLRDLKTLLVGCQAMQRYSGDADVTERLLAIIRDGLAIPG